MKLLESYQWNVVKLDVTVLELSEVLNGNCHDEPVGMT